MKILQGDCLEVMKTLPENSVDSIVTDPPYELGFMGKKWDNTGIANNKDMWAEALRVLKPGGHLLSFSGTRTYHRMAVAIEDAGFEVRDMIEWVYSTGFPKSLNLNKALQKKCKCGNMELYDNERTKALSQHNLRPMSESNLSQEINSTDKQGEVLQSCLSEQSPHGTVQGEEPKESSQWGEEPLLEGGNNLQKTEGKLQGCDVSEMSEGLSTNGEERRVHNATQTSDGPTLEQTTNENGSSTPHRPQSEQQQDRKPCAFCEQLGTQETRKLYEETYGVGTALKPSHEPICMARKPLSEKTVAENCLKWGTGGINIDESRVESSKEDIDNLYRTPSRGGIDGEFNSCKVIQSKPSSLGRFPANLIHDNSEEVRECFPDVHGAGNKRDMVKNLDYNASSYKLSNNKNPAISGDNGGNASRFFKSIIYTAKASKSERNEGCEGLEDSLGGSLEGGNDKRNGDKPQLKPTKNNHPTVKPIALMEYLIIMVTPKGGIVLDPFMGSGSTGVAAKKNGFDFIGIDMTPEYIEIAKARINATKIENKLI